MVRKIMSDQGAFSRDTKKTQTKHIFHKITTHFLCRIQEEYSRKVKEEFIKMFGKKKEKTACK